VNIQLWEDTNSYTGVNAQGVGASIPRFWDGGRGVYIKYYRIPECTGIRDKTLS